jgi:hypothetical protein
VDPFVAAFVAGPLDGHEYALHIDPMTGREVDPALPPSHLHLRVLNGALVLAAPPNASALLPIVDVVYYLTTDPHGDGFVYVFDPLSEKAVTS